jgi:hypothetical protein
MKMVNLITRMTMIGSTIIQGKGQGHLDGIITRNTKRVIGEAGVMRGVVEGEGEDLIPHHH